MEKRLFSELSVDFFSSPAVKLALILKSHDDLSSESLAAHRDSSLHTNHVARVSPECYFGPSWHMRIMKNLGFNIGNSEIHH